jgi:hypothetical protein
MNINFGLDAICFLTTAVLAVLKLCGIVGVNWLWVFVPAISVILANIGFVLMTVVLAISALKSLDEYPKEERKKRLNDIIKELEDVIKEKQKW